MFRYFFDFIIGQENWLNNMAERGFRLKNCGKISYVFEECKPSEYEYAIEYVGDKSYSKAKDYQKYLEDMGFRSFTKNINLNLSYGKVKWRPYAKGMGQIATSPGGINKELLILEKKKDGKPFKLHTDIRDKLHTYKTIRRSYLYAVLVLLGLVAMTFIPGVSSLSAAFTWTLRIIVALFAISYFIPTIKYSLLVNQMKEDSKTFD